MALYSKLDAVNQMLVAAGQSPVSSLSSDAAADTNLALFYLDAAVKDHQLRGLAVQQYEAVLTPEADLRIALPSKTIEVAFCDLVQTQNTKYTQQVIPAIRDGYLFNTQDNNPFWDASETYRLRLTVALDFEDVEPATQRSVVSTAAARYQLEQSGDANVAKRLAGEEAQFQYLNRQSDIRKRGSSILDSGSAFRATRGRNSDYYGNSGDAARYPQF